MNLSAVSVVLRFEWSRTVTLSRLAFVAALALFPVGMVFLMQYQGGHLEIPTRGTVALFVLVPEVVCLMALLLWATPMIHSELEGRTWSYLAMRPAGKASVLIGKYLNAVGWTILTGWLGLTLSLPVVHPQQQTLRIWGVLAVLVIFSSLAYGALYALLGVLFLRRAMVVAVGYTVVLELLVAFVPAVINQVTVQYHLRGLLVKWMQWKEVHSNDPLLFSEVSPWHHVLVLLVLTGGLLAAAALILRRRELVKPEEN